VHATAVTACQSMPIGQLSMCTMASCDNCCTHSLLGPYYLLYLFSYRYSSGCYLSVLLFAIV